MGSPEHVAALDLGSNSFHLVVARVGEGRPHIVDRMREQVGLAAGLDADNRLDDATFSKAIDVLTRFGERVRHLPQGAVRAVGTNSLRRARNSAPFLAEASRVLGHRVEIVSGQEEARLVYLGVARHVPELPARRLVVDLGGGSTELILGEGLAPIERDSVQMGHLRWTIRYFAQGLITEKGFAAGGTHARLELGELKRRYQALGWDVAYGSSGTVRTIEEVLLGSGWSTRGITREGLARLERTLVSAGSLAAVLALELPGISPDRVDGLAGGACILAAVFDTLKIEEMTASQGALREGLLYDLFGRIHHEDARDLTIADFQRRYLVDRSHAARVERTALAILAQVAQAWEIDPEEGPRFLSWAARLHEIGLSVNHSGHHKHGAYLLQHADMAGFSRDDQQVLAALVGGQRRKLRPDRVAPTMSEARRELCFHLTIALRLAVRLHRTRSSDGVPQLEVRAAGRELRIRLPPRFLEEHPLRRAELQDEAAVLRSAGITLRLQ